jgi:anthranilate/para-aminobenzoate synthase component II
MPHNVYYSSNKQDEPMISICLSYQAILEAAHLGTLSADETLALASARSILFASYLYY